MVGKGEQKGGLEKVGKEGIESEEMVRRGCAWRYGRARERERALTEGESEKERAYEARM